MFSAGLGNNFDVSRPVFIGALERPVGEPTLTVGKKSIRALAIVLAIFLCFECQFLSFYACYKEYKA